MKKNWLYLLIVPVVLTVFILPIGGRPLLSPDETRYAEIPRSCPVFAPFCPVSPSKVPRSITCGR